MVVQEGNMDIGLHRRVRGRVRPAMPPPTRIHSEAKVDTAISFDTTCDICYSSIGKIVEIGGCKVMVCQSCEWISKVLVARLANGDTISHIMNHYERLAQSERFNNRVYNQLYEGAKSVMVLMRGDSSG
jgi:hypothetical protein